MEKYERVMPLAALELRGIHQEENKEEKGSIFTYVYQQAWKTIGQIIQDNEKVEKRNAKIQHHSFDPLIRTEVQNVIAFTGRRGTGKTSAMVSMAAALHNGGDSIPKITELNEGNNIRLADYNFYVLPCIEAGLLSSDEFFNAVVSQMVMMLEEKENQQKNLDQFMGQGISRVKQSLCDLFIVSDAVENDYSNSNYPALMEIAEKHRTRRNFYKRVKEYLELLNRLSTNYDNYYSRCKKENKSYLVIMVDDIDVASDKSYDILQKIFQYLMIPNVIVLTTFHMETLLHVLDESKVEVTKYIEKRVFVNRYGVTEFLRKIIPVDRRIVMPSWKRMDYRQLFPLEINIGEGGMIQRYDNTENKVDMTKVFPRLYQHSFLYILSKNAVGEKRIRPKQLIFCMLADRTGVYLDVCGTKRHFMEPDSLRHMYDLFRFFYYMEDFRAPNLNAEERGYRVSLNLKALLDLFHFKMVPELELEKQRESGLFDEITAEPFDRKIKKVMPQLYAPTGILSINERQRRGVNPSYGDFFYELYKASRNNTRSKKYVQAVLANFSFTMPAVFAEYTKLRDMVSREEQILSEDELKVGTPLWRKMCEQKNSLCPIFGSSCLGSWNNILCTGDAAAKTYAVLKCQEITPEVWLLLMLIPYDQNDELRLFDMYDINKMPDNKRKTEVGRLEKAGITNISSDDIILSFPIDLSAFVMNTFFYEEFIGKMKSYFRDRGLAEDLYQNSMKKIQEKLKTYNEDAAYMALPLQHTDMLYNVIKRTVSDMVYLNDFALDIDKKKSQMLLESSLFYVIRSFYHRLWIHLNKQDEFYQFSNSKDSFNFSSRFKKCPVVEMFLSVPDSTNEIRDNLKRYEAPLAEDIKIWRE